MIVAGASRQLGRLDDAGEWLAKAERHFRLTVTSDLLVSHVEVERLCVAYEKRHYREVVFAAGRLASITKRMDLGRVTLKCGLLEAMALKNLGETEEAALLLAALTRELETAGESALLGQCLVTWGNLLSMDGQYKEALALYERTKALLRTGAPGMTAAHLFAALAECLRDQGRLDLAIHYYRASFREYSACGMLKWAAYSGVLLADALLRAGRARDAENEIAAVLPIIEELGLTHEGFAAIAVLKESVRRRSMDPNALRELREKLLSKRWE